MKNVDEDRKHFYSSCFEKGYQWYLSQQEKDGSLGTALSDEATYYNTLYVFAIGGRWIEARRFYDWAQGKIIENDGTLSVDPDGVFATRAIYFKGWNIWGAHMCGMFDMSIKVIAALLTYQDKDLGGFYVSKRRMEAGEGLLEHNTTAMGGMACLVTGKVKEAVAAGNFQVDILEKQPDLDKGLYGYMDPLNRTLITEIDKDDVPAGDEIYAKKKGVRKSDIDRYLFYIDNESDEIQPYANLGVPLAFMCYLYKATGTKSYLDAAMKLFSFLEYAGQRCWIKGQTTKVLWGLSLLYDITGEERVLKAIHLLCEHLCRSQLDNGAWIAPIGYDDFARQPKWVSICVTGDILLSIKAVLTVL